ncbi:transcription factor E2F8 isoform X1 [Cephus cinctus]|uniref:Transcription factor E2F8 isoform X1 n=1 Tax=Cephus cinctus TaxID=211228 RepID=A0AAJ7BYX6_CEPCN|nr:transcription factor E2F8 isoform X1 [Cephus cinctus]
MSESGHTTIRSSPEPDRKVICDLGNAIATPISPTANLRLLTTLASNLKSAADWSNSNKSPRSNLELFHEISDSDPLKLLPRKEKSLGLLCNKFLSLYPLNKANDVPEEISLDCTAKALGTEKRRIYDIINILESLEMASKVGKNRYRWHGQNGLSGTLVKLKATAIRLGLREQIREIQKNHGAYDGQFDEDSLSSLLATPPLQGSSSDIIKEDKSLGLMCQKFVMLFLVSLKNGVINLDIAAKVLISDSDRTPEAGDTSLRSRFKTKVRRLYDIANVLTAIGLIEKVSTRDNTIKKPVFIYTGPNVDYVDFDAETPKNEGKALSLLGTLTPVRSVTKMSLPKRLSEGSKLQTRNRFSSSSNNSSYNGSTPVYDRREPRKRKLFGPDESFMRTKSSPCLDTNGRSSERLNDSILRVAEMELKKLRSSERTKPKVCTKLFPRHNSDSCISATQIIPNIQNYSNGSTSSLNSLLYDQSGSKVQSNSTALVLLSSKENLHENNQHYIVTTETMKSAANVEISPRPDSSQVRTIHPQREAEGSKTKPAMLKILDYNIVSQVKDATNVSYKSPVTDVSTTTSNIKKIVKRRPYNVRSNVNSLKLVNLANFDAKKLVPIKPSDLRISVTTVSTPTSTVITPSPLPTVIFESPNIGNASFSILTGIPAQVLSPGDTFKAVKVGNTVQLVQVYDDSSKATNHGNITMDSS